MADPLCDDSLNCTTLREHLVLLNPRLGVKLCNVPSRCPAWCPGADIAYGARGLCSAREQPLRPTSLSGRRGDGGGTARGSYAGGSKTLLLCYAITMRCPPIVLAVAVTSDTDSRCCATPSLCCVQYLPSVCSYQSSPEVLAAQEVTAFPTNERPIMLCVCYAMSELSCYALAMPRPSCPTQPLSVSDADRA
eukprot:3847796-Rhodomonas_salina.5